MMYHGVKHVLRKILGLIYHRWHQHVRHQNPCNVCPFNVGHLAMHKMQRMHLWKRYIYYVTFVMQNAVVQNATIFFFSWLVSAPVIFQKQKQERPLGWFLTPKAQIYCACLAKVPVSWIYLPFAFLLSNQLFLWQASQQLSRLRLVSTWLPKS